jgi:hypothetical protein
MLTGVGIVLRTGVLTKVCTKGEKMWWEKNQYDPSEKRHNDGRIWHPYTKWEDAANGMYKRFDSETRSFMLQNAVDFTGDHALYGEYMEKVTSCWPVSCEHNLSARGGVNRKAWIGHAACCLALGIPEDVTREAWGKLTAEQRRKANKQAESAIKAWEKKRRARGAKDKARPECFRGSKGEDINNFRPVQQDIFEFLRRKGLNCDASPCNG